MISDFSLKYKIVLFEGEIKSSFYRRDWLAPKGFPQSQSLLPLPLKIAINCFNYYNYYNMILRHR